jgi:chromosome partitioning protein
MFGTVIRKTVAIDETTFMGKPIMDYSKRSTAAMDYAALVEEYLKICL